MSKDKKIDPTTPRLRRADPTTLKLRRAERETVGAISSRLMQKEPETRDPIEIQREVHKDYEDQIHACISRSKKDFDGDFFVVVLTKKERLMPNVLRNYFFSRLSCPTPEYDQAVYKYHRKNDMIEFLWVVPSKDTCQLLRDNALQVDESEKQLLGYVLDFYAGSLLTLAKRLNKEQVASPFIEKK